MFAILLRIRRLDSIACFVWILSLVSGDPINFNDCGKLRLSIFFASFPQFHLFSSGSAFDLTQVDIDGCSSLPCPLVMGQTYDITIQFVSCKLKAS